MAGYTDSPMKQVVRSLSQEVVVVTEFLSADALFYQSPKTLKMMEFDPLEHPVILQVFGKDPKRFTYAAQLAEKMGYDGVDINMGCPAKKVIHSDHGSALVKIKNRSTAMKIVSEMAKAVKIPISVKTRLGFENADELIPFCKDLEQNGCAAITIHGRTTKQGYRGDANWDPIYEVKSNISIPVLGNGDITSVSAFRKKIKNLDGVFIARASLGDPWFLADLVNYRNHANEYRDLSDEALDKIFPRIEHIPWDIRKPIILRHLELSVQIKGEKLGILEMRKHLAAYIKGISGAKEWREKLVRVETFDEAKKIIEAIRSDEPDS